jgi:hypothetical protein
VLGRWLLPAQCQRRTWVAAAEVRREFGEC